MYIYVVKQQLLFLVMTHTCQNDITFKKRKERANVANQEWDLKYHITRRSFLPNLSINLQREVLLVKAI